MTTGKPDTHPSSQTELNPRSLYYSPDRRIRTKSAAREALRVVEWIRTRGAENINPDNKILFVALHTCAYRAARRSARSDIPAAERNEWARRWRLIRTYLTEQNLGLAHSMVIRFCARYADEDALLSDALYTLMRAVERFNPWKGFQFSTYACNAILRGLTYRERRESRYRQCFPVRYGLTPHYPDAPAETEPEPGADRLREVLKRNLGELTERESAVLRWRFPPGHRTQLRLKEIGERIGLSKERVRQIQKAALCKLRKTLSEDLMLERSALACGCRSRFPRK